jgi:hypothetical protein
VVRRAAVELLLPAEAEDDAAVRWFPSGAGQAIRAESSGGDDGTDDPEVVGEAEG